MPIYFKGHKDSCIINEYLSSRSEESNDFQVVYRLRKIGESFVDGSLSMDVVLDFARFIPASPDAEFFIRQMKCFTFYSSICSIALEKPLSLFEQTIKNEIEHPSYCCVNAPTVCLKIRNKINQIWLTRWKHPLVFNEYWLPALITKIWSVVRGREIIKD